MKNDKIKQNLIKLLDNCYSEIDKFKCSCCTVTKDGKEFYGVNLKNSVYRDSIYAEVSSITNAISNRYKAGSFDAIYILSSSNNFNICREVIKEFFDLNSLIYLYEFNNDNCKIIKVSEL